MAMVMLKTWPAGPTGEVRPASELAESVASGGADRLLPVAAELRPLLPAGGLRRGSTVAVTPGCRSLVLALLSEASAGGAWAGVVGMSGLGAVAAAELGVVLERLALVPYPGPEWPAVVAALLDGLDLVVVAPPGQVGARVTRRLAARARQRGSVLMPYGEWDGADLTLSAERAVWQGLGAGRGRLRRRKLTITARGRGAAAQPRRVRVWLPDPAGRLAPVPATDETSDGRPALTVIEGGAP
jgi:hypothetical protein